MEESGIGSRSGEFYSAICEVCESKREFLQADKYVLEARYKDAQPPERVTRLCKEFENRMEARI